MLGQSVQIRGSASSAENRLFVYEVTGLRQNDATTNHLYAVRNSSCTYIQVPYSRMNEEMRRITRLGGTIVRIRPSGLVES
jgi:phycocyanin-associated, rod